MSVEMLRSVLLWCTLINFGLLLFWGLLFLFAHDWVYRLTSKWARLSVEQFDGINFAWIMIFKIGVILFNLVPCIALHIAG